MSTNLGNWTLPARARGRFGSTVLARLATRIEGACRPAVNRSVPGARFSAFRPRSVKGRRGHESATFGPATSRRAGHKGLAVHQDRRRSICGDVTAGNTTSPRSAAERRCPLHPGRESRSRRVCRDHDHGDGYGGGGGGHGDHCRVERRRHRRRRRRGRAGAGPQARARQSTQTTGIHPKNTLSTTIEPALWTRRR